MVIVGMKGEGKAPSSKLQATSDKRSHRKEGALGTVGPGGLILKNQTSKFRENSTLKHQIRGRSLNKKTIMKFCAVEVGKFPSAPASTHGP
jgi:hypothetical protein